MSRGILRRAAALGLSLAVVVSGIAVADTVVTDGDLITAGSQAAVYLGEVPPGAGVSLDVALRLTCKGSSHVEAGSTIAVSVSDQSWPADGSATATGGSIAVPADWPAPGEACPGYGVPSTLGSTPVHLELVAPTAPGTGFAFTFLLAADPGTGVTNTISFTATLDVVADVTVPAADTTPPALTDLPADLLAFTSGSSAVVSWSGPTAADDTDPDPVVACNPASGSAFPPGTTTVTCTATDVSGNAAQGSFLVTVRQLEAAWGRPLDGDAIPALVGRLGRTIPLKLTVTEGEASRGTGPVAPPALVLEQLAAAAPGSTVLDTRAIGTFVRTDGAWHLNLRTADLASGPWRLTATVDGVPLASVIVLLVADPSTKAALRSAR